jgi:hypothetical protein
MDTLGRRTAWNDLGKMTQQEAMHKYAETVDKLVPGWDRSSTVRVVSSAVHARLHSAPGYGKQ